MDLVEQLRDSTQWRAKPLPGERRCAIFLDFTLLIGYFGR